MVQEPEASEETERRDGAAGEQAERVLYWVAAGGSMGSDGCSSKNVEEVYHGNHTEWTVDGGLLFVYAFILTSTNIPFVLIINF